MLKKILLLLSFHFREDTVCQTDAEFKLLSKAPSRKFEQCSLANLFQSVILFSNRKLAPAFYCSIFFFFLHQLLMEQKRHVGTFFHEISCYVSKEYYEDYVIKPVSPGGPDRSTPDRYTLGVFLFLVYYSYVHDRTLWFLFLVNDSYFQDHNLDSDIKDVPLVRWWCVFRL